MPRLVETPLDHYSRSLYTSLASKHYSIAQLNFIIAFHSLIFIIELSEDIFCEKETMTFWKGRPPIKNVMVSFSQKKNLPTYNCFCFISTENRSGHTCFLDTAFSSKLICNWNV